MRRLSELEAAVEERLGEVDPDPVGVRSYARLVLGDVCDVLAGPARIGADDGSAVVPVVVPRNIRHGRLSSDVHSAIPRHLVAKMGRYRLEPGDVVGVRAGDLGRFGVVEPDHASWLLGPGCLRLRPRREIDARYLVHLLSSSAARDWMDRRAAGSAVKAINTRVLLDLPLELPGLAEQRRIAGVLQTLDTEAEMHERLGTLTTGLRDALRESLTSGTAVVVGY